MAINGLPPGLAKKAESGNLPANNPHVKAYKAQQASDAQSQEIADLKKQLEAANKENTAPKETTNKPGSQQPQDVASLLVQALMDLINTITGPAKPLDATEAPTKATPESATITNKPTTVLNAVA